MLSFAAPEYLYGLLFLPLIPLLFWILWRQVERVRRQILPARLFGRARPSTPFRYFRLTLWCTLAGASLLLAVAQPQIETEHDVEIYQKVNVVILLDNSLSMRAQDIVPSRLDRARQEIRNFILHRVENIGSLGLVSFAGSSVILSYLTEDVSNILFYLDYLRADTHSSLGTDIGGAIQNGLFLLEKEKELNPSLNFKDVIFILISDGEDHGTTLQEAVQKAAHLGIRIYTLGLGTRLGAYIPVGERNGRTQFLINEEGERVLATFDERVLRWVAARTGGLYYRSQSGTELYENLNEILWNARRLLGVQKETDKRPVHHWFLLAAFFSLLLFLVD